MLFDRMEQLASTVEISFPIVVIVSLYRRWLDRCYTGVAQLLTLGIAGEYISRIYEEVKGRPRYLLRGSMNVAEEQREKQSLNAKRRSDAKRAAGKKLTEGLF